MGKEMQSFRGDDVLISQNSSFESMNVVLKRLGLFEYIEEFDLFYFMVFFFLMKPYIFNELPIFDLLVNSGKLVLFLFLLYKWAFNKRKSNLTYIAIAFCGVIIFSTIINQGSIYRAISPSIPMLGIFFFMDVYLFDFRRIIYSFEKIAEAFLYLNLLSILLMGNSNDELKVYFLGSKNGLTIIIPLYIILNMIYTSFFTSSKIRECMFYGVILISILLTKSTTMLIEIFLFFSLMFFRRVNKFLPFINYWFYYVIYLISNFLLTFFFAFFSEYMNYLEKGSDTMSIRLRLWVNSITIWLNNFWIGVGKYTEKQYWYWFPDCGDYKTQLHNNIFEFAFLGGFCLLFLYIVFSIMVGRQIVKYNNLRLGYAITVSCFMAYISVITSAIYNAEFFLIFLLAYFYGEIEKSIRMKNSILFVSCPNISVGDKHI